MEKHRKSASRGDSLPMQEFNGKKYYLYKGEKYYSKHNKRLHRVVWEYYNGPIPAGYHIHHKDGNPANNDIANLELIKGSEHESRHQREQAENPEILAAKRARMLHAGESAKEWHRSEEGRAWHSEHAKSQIRIEREYICTVCGSKYRSRNSATKYCSAKCNAKARRDSGADNEIRRCEVCGKEFETNKYKKQRFCSAACSSKHRIIGSGRG